MPQVLTVLALVLVAFFIVTTAVIAAAPYVAIAAIIWGIGWSIGQEADDPPTQK
jgi:prepilin signal peptidase PulO-like enzyme (type II secretory pathway)